MRLVNARSSHLAKRPPPRGPYLWQRPDWPALTFDAQAVAPVIAEARRAQGAVEAKALAIGIERTGEIAREVLERETLATAAIEGEKLPADAVRSSVLRRLGLARGGPVDRHVDGLVQVIGDATAAFDAPLDEDRLCRWQAALFPGGTSGIRRIAVGRYREHADPMQIVSGPPGREVVHYEAPPSSRVRGEMRRFLAWFARTAPSATGRTGAIDGLARAAIAHLWFETVHPFEDGNGRLGRAIADMAIAQDHRVPVRLYSLSQQLLDTRGAYYDALNAAQRGDVDTTAWVGWFAEQFALACRRSGETLDRAIEKSRFWSDRAAAGVLNERQRKVLQRLLDDGDGGFAGGLNADKYVAMTGASKATATRDLSDLVAKTLLRTTGQGKALRYYIDVPGWTHGLASAA